MNTQTTVDGKLIEQIDFTPFQKEDERLVVPYSILVNLFGKNLRKNFARRLISIMCTQSGLSEKISFASTITAKCSSENLYSAFCLYPQHFGRECPYHEGVHFLSQYRIPSTRIIKNSVPLANVLSEFIKMQDHPPPSK